MLKTTTVRLSGRCLAFLLCLILPFSLSFPLISARTARGEETAPAAQTAGEEAGGEEEGEGEAEDITASCALTFSTKEQKKAAARVRDNRYDTAWTCTGKSAWVVARSAAPEEKPIGSIYLTFDRMPAQWAVQVPSGEAEGDWETVYTGDDRFIHVWVPLEVPAAAVRFLSLESKVKVTIPELRVYAPGSFPQGAQSWLPTWDEADILFLSAHADDELIFFGGGIPTYDTERGYRVVVAYLTGCGIRRNHELLNGLWSMGVRHYPVIGPFPDRHKKSMTAEYQALGGQKKVVGWVTWLFRRYRPKVVVTHDTRGEYGHYQHRVTAAAALMAWDRAADPSRYPDSAGTCGTWQVQKLYLHLGKTNPITMDWDVPLPSLGGITGLDAAIRAYTYHVSQQTTSMSVTKTGTRYSNRLFGLEKTMVGPDEAGGDFMEHIEPWGEEESLP